MRYPAWLTRRGTPYIPGINTQSFDEKRNPANLQRRRRVIKETHKYRGLESLTFCLANDPLFPENKLGRPRQLQVVGNYSRIFTCVN